MILADDERDVSTTTLQVSVDGHVPEPARVGGEDVAALAVEAALFDSKALLPSSRDNGGRCHSSVSTSLSSHARCSMDGTKYESVSSSREHG